MALNKIARPNAKVPNNFKNNQYLPGELPRRKVEGVGGFARIRTNNGRSILNENTITYSKEFGDHSVKVLGGFTLQKISNESTDMSAEGFPNDVLEYNNMATECNVMPLDK